MRTTKDIVVKQGAILDQTPTNWGSLSSGHVCTPVAFGKDMTGWLVVQDCDDLHNSGYVDRSI